MGTITGINEMVASKVLMPLLVAALVGTAAVVYSHDTTLAAAEATTSAREKASELNYRTQSEFNKMVSSYIISNEKRLYEVENKSALDKLTITNIEKTLIRIEKAVEQ
jgi:hypothetical protein